MELHLLGTSGYYPSETRHTACLMLPSAGVVLDAGTGMFRLPDCLQTDELDIFLTHAHLDHVVGLTYLLGIVHRHPLRRVTVHAEADKLAAIEEHLFAEPLFPVKPTFEMRPLEDRVPVGGDGLVTHFPLKHPGGTVGYRLDWPNASMVYVTDTTAGEDVDYVEAIRSVDLLVHECYFSDKQENLAQTTGHSCLTSVVTLAKAAEVKKLVLVHIDPAAGDGETLDLQAARRIFPETELGWDQMVVEF